LDTANNQQFNTLLKALNLFEAQSSPQTILFLKSKPQIRPEEKVEKLAIGFHANEENDQIDES
jgi:hypothetical protein